MRGPNRPYLYAVDHLRAFAAVLVLLYHSVQLLSQAVDPASGWSPSRWLYSGNPLLTWIFEGHTGVALFMVLSGFIFTIGTVGREVRYWPFMRNRLLRIYPLYLVLLVVGVTLMGGGSTLADLAYGVLPLSSFGPVSVGGAWGAMFWAVAVEMQFYLLFPLLLTLLNRSGPRALVGIVAAMVALRTLAVVASPNGLDMNGFTYFSIVGRLDQFLIGMLAAWLFTRYRARLAPLLLALSVTAAVGMLWAFNQLQGYSAAPAWRVVWVDVEAVVWAAVIVSYTWVLGTRSGAPTRLVAFVGERSYSIYLLHFVVITAVVTHVTSFPRVGGAVVSAFALGAAVVLPVTFALACLTYATIERPLLRLRGPYLVPLESGPTGTVDVAPEPAASPVREPVGAAEAAGPSR